MSDGVWCDREPLRELTGWAPSVRTGPAGGAPGAWIDAAEALLGPLPPSYRWWLVAFGGGTVAGAELACVAPPGALDTPEAVTAQAVAAGGPPGDGLLPFAAEPDGDRFLFDLTARRASGECPVLRADGIDGRLDPFADTFVGFLTVSVARAEGLGDGPNPAVARLWRRGPGVRLPGGVQLYGPHLIAERNTTHAVTGYAPGWVLVGDDSGGGGLLMRRHGVDRASVYRLDLGAIGPDAAEDGERVTGDLPGWIASGAPLPGASG
ncbi:SMI1/KNR4 family protein [Streptomyces otsuchiensis]|uniref:SMI1/KNR4 family protein n=1 Tax=Streptomyces otsuchiensis TaxID=2681388 RepID=UPI00103175E1|nr:SMI1/KNR4 family protein [Streptomyces otsuchiensis]